MNKEKFISIQCSDDNWNFNSGKGIKKESNDKIIVSKEVIFTTEVTQIDGEIRDELLGDFKEWLLDISTELGTGKHKETYYDCDESGKNHVNVFFTVKSTTKK